MTALFARIDRGSLIWLACALALTASLLVPIPFVRVYAAFGLLLVMPGLWVARRYARNPAEALAIGFCVSLMLLIPAWAVGYGLALPFSDVKWIYAATIVVAAALWPGRRESTPAPWRRSHWILLGLGLSWVAFAHVVGAYQASAGSDSTPTVMVLRKLVEQPSLGPISFLLDRYDLGVTATSYQIWYLAVALVGDVAKVDVIDTWVNLPTVVVPITLAAFYTFVCAAFDDDRVGIVAAVIFVWVLIVYRPVGTQVQAFPTNVAGIALNLALARLFLALRAPTMARMAGAVAFGVLAVLLYLGALMVFAVALVAFALWLFAISRDPRSARRVAIILGAVLVITAPYLSVHIPLQLHDQAVMQDVRSHADKFTTVFGWRIASLHGLYVALRGPSGWQFVSLILALVAVIPLWAYRRTYFGAYFLSTVLVVPLTLFNPLAVEILHQIIQPGKIVKSFPAIASSAAIPLLGFSAVRLFDRVRASAHGRTIAWSAGIAAALLLGVFSWWRYDFLAERYFKSSIMAALWDHVIDRQLVKHGFLTDPPPIFRELRNLVEDGATVASASLRIAAFANVFLPSDAGREDMVKMFSPAVSGKDTIDLMRRHGVDYVLEYVPVSKPTAEQMVNKFGLQLELVHDRSKFARWPHAFEPIYAHDGWTLFRFNGAGVAQNAPQASSKGG